MKLDIGGTQAIQADEVALWQALNDPAVLTKCIPGCTAMTEIGPDAYKVDMELKVAGIGGTFAGEISLSDKLPPRTCIISVSGAGTLGNGTGTAQFEIERADDGDTSLIYRGEGEIGGLVVGVGQRILRSVSKHLIKQFFTALTQHLSDPVGV
jgi:uncharacterized protein